MRIPRLALALTAAAALAVLGASPATASDSASSAVRTVSAPTAFAGLPVTEVVDSLCGLLPGTIKLAPCTESTQADPWDV